MSKYRTNYKVKEYLRPTKMGSAGGQVNLHLVIPTLPADFWWRYTKYRLWGEK